jgi:HSP20 family protein
VAQVPFTAIADARELADDVRALFDDLATSLAHEHRAYSGECHPVLDVYETDAGIELLVDLSGVPPEAIRVLFKDGVVLIAGEKAPPPPAGDQTFHLVEREFGRFARAVRVTGAFDVANAKATLRDGELTILLPKRVERRGQSQRIAVTSGDRPA